MLLTAHAVGRLRIITCSHHTCSRSKFCFFLICDRLLAWTDQGTCFPPALLSLRPASLLLPGFQPTPDTPVYFRVTPDRTSGPGPFAATSESHVAPGDHEPMLANDTETQQEYNEFPRVSLVTAQLTASIPTSWSSPAPRITSALPTVQASITAREREAFVATLPTRVQVKLNQPFGKDNLVQCFSSEACLRHVLLPLYKSAFLSREPDWSAFAAASPVVTTFLAVVDDHAMVDFRPLQGFYSNWDAATAIEHDRVRMATAALLHFDGDVADLVRWIGGTHAGAHRDIGSTLAYLRGKISPHLCGTLERIWRHGAPTACNASASDANFEAYRMYGNHASVNDEPDVTYRTLLKDSKRGYCIVFDQRMARFALNCHLTPNGLVDANHPHKNPRPIFDGSFRPEPWCSGINDWTTTTTEPPINFATAFINFLRWIYNARITYPREELYLGDDDISGAFRHQKYHPNLVGMHSCMVAGFMSCATGMAFGDNTSSANFDPIAEARKELARYLWSQPDTVTRAASHLPTIELATPPTATEVDCFSPAEPDTINHGVLDASGHRLPPQFDHHVDDNIYGDVAAYMAQTVSASALALWHVLGFPNPLHGPNPLSLEKFDGRYTHQRKTLGHLVDSRTLEVCVLPEKRAVMAATLQDWLGNRADFNLREISSLHGSLESMTRHVTWMRPLFFAIQNTIRHELSKRYYVLKRMYDKTGRAARIRAQLPPALLDRLSTLIARDKAALLWSSRTKLVITQSIRAALTTIHSVISDATVRLAQPIGFIIPRDPLAESRGDASGLGGGAYCEQLAYWFDITWSERVRKGITLPSSAPGFVHINSTEFVVVLLQLVAFTVRLETLTTARQAILLPAGIPAHPILLCCTDNTPAEAWANRVTSKSPQGQPLIGVLAALLRARPIGLNTNHIAGSDNILADFISRPTHFALSHADRSEQIYRKHASARTWDYFLPSQELLQSLSYVLSSAPTLDLPSLPKNLGRFVPAGSTISCSPVI